MSTFVDTRLPKICHAQVGQKVRLPHPQTGDIHPEVFVVVALEQPGKRGPRSGVSQGLYDDERELMLVSLTTGLARKMPHLSSRAELIRANDLAAFFSPDEVPVLMPETVEAWYQVDMDIARGQRLAHAVNLADTEDVRALLERLQKTGARVAAVSEAADRPNDSQVLAQWRQEVAEGTTLLSFEEYKKACA
ncbi:hypothetical protein WL29_21450 [Burkholderia ubonensis]|uniref:Uncharacterized protein n=1 Tax=Burkholderia ubonensis TaxID=101571 RepID=A0A106QBH5_9BURK|nr:hypothetical protein [Burkholderia ubonensis]KWA83935.1 hypothetical protein WL29_21450 [Burkholderia ubonensis]